MRIVLSHPWCWPQVQRGGERLFADLGEYLATAGHDVLAVSSGPKPGTDTSASGRRQVVLPTRAGRLARWLRIDQAVTYLPATAREIRRFEPDLFHGMFHYDGVAGRLARQTARLVHIQGIARRSALAGRPIQRRLLRSSLADPTVRVAVSQAAADALAVEFGYEAVVLYNGVDTGPFDAAGRSVEASAEPTVLFPSSPDDPRKRLDLLLGALNLIAPRWPGLRLAVAAHAPPELRERVEAAALVPVDWLGMCGATAMPAAYASAWVTCAPAVREAFGLVFVESMAAGTPAVGVRDGGVPEVIDDPRWIAEPDDEESLGAAIDAALHDAQIRATADRCRAAASSFDWRTRGPCFEALYRDVARATS